MRASTRRPGSSSSPTPGSPAGPGRAGRRFPRRQRRPRRRRPVLRAHRVRPGAQLPGRCRRRGPARRRRGRRRPPRRRRRREPRAAPRRRDGRHGAAARQARPRGLGHRERRVRRLGRAAHRRVHRQGRHRHPARRRHRQRAGPPLRRRHRGAARRLRRDGDDADLDDVPSDTAASVVTVAGPLGAQFLLWEAATAVAGRLLGINPFDQPDVESAKAAARELLDAGIGAGEDPPSPTVRSRSGPSAVTGSVTPAPSTRPSTPSSGSSTAVAGTSRSWRTSTGRPTPTSSTSPVTSSTAPVAPPPSAGVPASSTPPGSTTRAGPDRCVRSDDQRRRRRTSTSRDVSFTFGQFIAAQAGGDATVLAEHGRPVLRLHLTDHDEGHSRRCAPPWAGVAREPGPGHRGVQPAARPPGQAAPADRRPVLPWCSSVSPATSLARSSCRPSTTSRTAGSCRRGSRSSASRAGLGRPGLRQDRLPVGPRAARTPFREEVWRSLAEASASSRAPSTTSRRSTSSPATVARARRAARHRWQPRVLPLHPPVVLRDGLPAARALRPLHTRGRLVAPGRHREAVRPRPRLGPRAQRHRREGLPRGRGLPDRPLPRQGDGPEPPRPALRQPDVRAGLERQLRRPRADHHGRGHRHRRSRRLLRRHRRRPRRHPEPPPPAAGAHRDGGAGLVRGRGPAPGEGEGPLGGPHARRPRAGTARGQYAKGWQGGEEVVGYLEEQGVAEDSSTETYAAVRLDLDTRRWAGVPFYLRTGKRLGKRVTEIAVVFKRAPHLPFATPPPRSSGRTPSSSACSPTRGSRCASAPRCPGRRWRSAT